MLETLVISVNYGQMMCPKTKFATEQRTLIGKHTLACKKHHCQWP